MANKLIGSILGLLAVVIPFANEANAETFEFLSYQTPPGWTKQEFADKTTYQRKSGIGAIAFYASYPTNGSAADEFAKMWRTHFETALSVKAPQPEIQREGDLTAAVGGQRVDAQGTITTSLMTVFVGRGRAICIVSLSAGDDTLREVTAFFESIRALPQNSTAQPNSGSASSGKIAFDYKIPPGLTAKNDGQSIMLTPPKIEKDNCAYWLSPPRPSQGSLEADARAAFRELPIQGKIYEEYADIIRGTAPDGWKYFLFGADIRNSLGSATNYAMILAFSGGAGQVNIILGIGDGASNCYGNDTNFVRLFHSLSPHGWTSDGGKAFSQELTGLWRWTAGGVAGYSNNNYYLMQYNFLANGRYASGGGNNTTTGILETTTTITSDGSYKMSGNSLTITPDSKRSVSKYQVRLYEVYSGGKWQRRMSFFNEELKAEVEYYGIEN